jgi:hypothetical protein
VFDYFTKVNKNLNSNSFSFFVSNDFGVLNFGSNTAGAFFSQSNGVTATQTTNWVVNFASSSASFEGKTSPVSAKPFKAQLSTATDYIFIDTTSFAALQGALQGSQLSANNLLTFPEIDYFETKNFQLQLQIDATNTVSVPLKKLAFNQDGNTVLKIKSSASAQWTLGYSFLHAVYTVFDAKNNQVTFYPANDFKVQSNRLNATNAIWLIIVGTLLALFSIFATLRALKPLGVVAPVNIAPAKDVKQKSTPISFVAPYAFQGAAPTTVVLQQPQQLIYSQVQPQPAGAFVSSLPGAASTSIGYLGQNSPTRYIQSSGFQSSAIGGFPVRTLVNQPSNN